MEQALVQLLLFVPARVLLFGPGTTPTAPTIHGPRATAAACPTNVAATAAAVTGCASVAASRGRCAESPPAANEQQLPCLPVEGRREEVVGGGTLPARLRCISLQDSPVC